MRPASLRRKSTSVTVIGNVAVGSYRAVSAAAAAARAPGAPAASSTPAPRAIIVITKPRRPVRWLSMRPPCSRGCPREESGRPEMFLLARLRVIRRQLQQPAVRAVGQHIDRTVLKDEHVANPLVETRQQRFLVDDFIVLAQLETENRLTGQATHEHAGLPLRKEVAAIEGQAGGRDHRIPEIPGLLQSRLLDNGAADLRAGIVDAVHDHRPAVVLA